MFRVQTHFFWLKTGDSLHLMRKFVEHVQILIEDTIRSMSFHSWKSNGSSYMRMALLHRRTRDPPAKAVDC